MQGHPRIIYFHGIFHYKPSIWGSSIYGNLHLVRGFPSWPCSVAKVQLDEQHQSCRCCCNGLIFTISPLDSLDDEERDTERERDRERETLFGSFGLPSNLRCCQRCSDALQRHVNTFYKTYVLNVFFVKHIKQRASGNSQPKVISMIPVVSIKYIPSHPLHYKTHHCGSSLPSIS